MQLIREDFAAAACKIEKDEKHQDCVEANGCLFYPLVVESLGTWLPSSLDALNVIAPRSMLVTGRTLGNIYASFQ